VPDEARGDGVRRVALKYDLLEKRHDHDPGDCVEIVGTVVSERADRQLLGHLKHLDQLHAAGRGRRREHAVAVIFAFNGRAEIRGESPEVVGGDESAVPVEVIDHPVGDLARVEILGAFGRQPLERAREIGLDHALAFLPGTPLVEKDGRARRRPRQRAHEPGIARPFLDVGPEARDIRVDVEALFGQTDRRRDRSGQATRALPHRSNSVRGAHKPGHHDGLITCLLISPRRHSDQLFPSVPYSRSTPRRRTEPIVDTYRASR
jgi:hypothetical protein